MRVESFYGKGGGLGFLSFAGFMKKQGCRCNGKTVQVNANLLDGECNSIRRFEAKDGLWKHWCYVNPEEDCEDIQDGWSFKACTEGKQYLARPRLYIFVYSDSFLFRMSQ